MISVFYNYVFSAIPKEQCIFELNLEGYFIQLYGKHFIIRSKDRSKKKLKENLILEL
jgi:RNase P/RNase MRP subunit p29